MRGALGPIYSTRYRSKGSPSQIPDEVPAELLTFLRLARQILSSRLKVFDEG
jgi:hypothetical protein